MINQSRRSRVREVAALRSAAAPTAEILAVPMLDRTAVDRACHLRADDGAVARLWLRPDARVMRVDGTDSVLTGDQNSLAWLRVPSLEATDPRSTLRDRYFLGLDGEGVPHFAVDGPFALEPGEAPISLRDVGPWLSPSEAGFFAHAVALAAWHERHRFCARCGSPTELRAAGHSRTCTGCAGRHFPRIDPTVVMLVLDDDDRLLLAHNKSWPEGRHSTLAGFMEAGESAEQAVMREVLEEVGLAVDRVEYEGSQPWPFPASTMFAFRAHAHRSELRINRGELTSARWFTRGDLFDAVERGVVKLPSSLSIARWQIERWFGGPLPPEHDW